MDFKPGDLVFAKIKGYPAWPARVEPPDPAMPTPKAKPYLIFFFGTHEIGFASSKDLFHYLEYRETFAIPKRVRGYQEGLYEIEKTPTVGRFEPVGGSDRIPIITEDGKLNISSGEALTPSSTDVVVQASGKAKARSAPVEKQKPTKTRSRPRSKVDKTNEAEVAETSEPRRHLRRSQLITDEDATASANREPVTPEGVSDDLVVDVSYELHEDTTRLRGCPKATSVSPDAIVDLKSDEPINAAEVEEKVAEFLEASKKKAMRDKQKEHELESSVTSHSYSVDKKRRHSRSRFILNDESDEQEDEEEAPVTLRELRTKRKKAEKFERSSSANSDGDSKDNRRSSRLRGDNMDCSQKYGFRDQSWSSFKKDARQSPIPDDPRTNISKPVMDDARCLLRLELELKRSLQLNHHDVPKAIETLDACKEKLADPMTHPDTILGVATLIEVLRKCRKFTASKEVRDKAADCLFIVQQRFSTSDSPAVSRLNSQTEEEWLKAYRESSEEYFKQHADWAQFVKSCISVPAPTKPKTSVEAEKNSESSGDAAAVNSNEKQDAPPAEPVQDDILPPLSVSPAEPPASSSLVPLPLVSNSATDPQPVDFTETTSSCSFHSATASATVQATLGIDVVDATANASTSEDVKPTVVLVNNTPPQPKSIISLIKAKEGLLTALPKRVFPPAVTNVVAMTKGTIRKDIVDLEFD